MGDEDAFLIKGRKGGEGKKKGKGSSVTWRWLFIAKLQGLVILGVVTLRF